MLGVRQRAPGHVIGDFMDYLQSRAHGGGIRSFLHRSLQLLCHLSSFEPVRRHNAKATPTALPTAPEAGKTTPTDVTGPFIHSPPFRGAAAWRRLRRTRERSPTQATRSNSADAKPSVCRRQQDPSQQISVSLASTAKSCCSNMTQQATKHGLKSGAIGDGAPSGDVSRV